MLIDALNYYVNTIPNKPTKINANWNEIADNELVLSEKNL